MEKNEALKFLVARMSKCDFAVTESKTDFHNCSFRLSFEQLAQVNAIASQCSLSRSKTMVTLMRLGIDELLASVDLQKEKS
jgi:hypothetical protein